MKLTGDDVTEYLKLVQIMNVDCWVVSNIINKIKRKFGKKKKTRGSTHEFLGMYICIRSDGKVQICMKGYLQEAIRDSNMDTTQSAATPATKHLFDIDDTAQELCESDANTY